MRPARSAGQGSRVPCKGLRGKAASYRAGNAAMLVAGLLVALQVGKCEDIPGFPRRVTGFHDGLATEFCENARGDRYNGADGVCRVSDAYSCCKLEHPPEGTLAACFDIPKAFCDSPGAPAQWCPPPAEPADDGISEAIVTVIVFVSLVAVAGAAGAYSVCRGAARS